MPFSNSYGYTISDEVIEQIKDGSYPNLDEICSECLGITLDEEENDDFVDSSVENYKFIGFDEHAMFEAAFEDGRNYVFPVSLMYFDTDD